MMHPTNRTHHHPGAAFFLLALLGAVCVPVRAQSPPPKPLYSVQELGNLGGSFTQAEGMGAGSVAVGQAQPNRPAPPTLVGTVYRRNDLSYFDSNNGYTNRQNLDVLALVSILTHPQYLRDYYSNKRIDAEHQMDEKRGVVFPPSESVGAPVLLDGRHAQELPTPVNRGGIALNRNVSGVVVGAVRYSPVSDVFHAAVWLKGETVNGKKSNAYQCVDLEVKQKPGSSVAVGVNQAGMIVGGADSGYGVLRAFRWADLAPDTEGDLIPRLRQNLGTLGGPRSLARAVNDKGQIVGWAETAPEHVQGFLWEPSGSSGTMRPLGTPPSLPVGTQTEARALTSGGTSVGVAYLPDGKRCAVRWDDQGGGVALPLLPGVSGMEATALSETGVVVGFAYDTPPQDGPATNATPDKVGSEALPVSPGLLSPPGQAPPPPSTWAVVWDGNQVLDLNTLIDARSGWVLRRATAISAQGEIVGWGTFKGKVRAFRLKPLSALTGLPR